MSPLGNGRPRRYVPGGTVLPLNAAVSLAADFDSRDEDPDLGFDSVGNPTDVDFYSGSWLFLFQKRRLFIKSSGAGKLSVS